MRLVLTMRLVLIIYLLEVVVLETILLLILVLVLYLIMIGISLLPRFKVISMLLLYFLLIRIHEYWLVWNFTIVLLIFFGRNELILIERITFYKSINTFISLFFQTVNGLRLKLVFSFLLFLFLHLLLLMARSINGSNSETWLVFLLSFIIFLV